MDYNYVYGLGQRLAKYKGTEQYLYHNDHLGSLRALSTPSGTVVGSQDYYPYGGQLSITGSPGKYAYNQKEYLDDWGFDLYYYGARFMDPVTGRFLTPDPVRDYLNPYSYVGNNPLNRIDPTGMNDFKVSFSSATGYDFGGNPFRWLKKEIWRLWIRSEYGGGGVSAREIQQEIEERENAQKVYNLIEEIKGEVKQLADQAVGPNKWHVVLNELTKLTDSYDTENGVFGLIDFVENLTYTNSEGESGFTFASSPANMAGIKLNLVLFGGVYSGQWVKSLIVHELSHRYYGGGTDEQEYSTQETQMEYWDRFGPDLTHNEVENYWQQIHNNWLDERRQLGSRYNLYNFWRGR